MSELQENVRRFFSGLLLPRYDLVDLAPVLDRLSAGAAPQQLASLAQLGNREMSMPASSSARVVPYRSLLAKEDKESRPYRTALTVLE